MNSSKDARARDEGDNRHVPQPPAALDPAATGRFWSHLDQLVAATSVVIDRPKGSRHPRYPSMRYPLDYGYLKATTSGDGEGIDVWVGSRDVNDHSRDGDDRSHGTGNRPPRGTITGVICALDLEKRDLELKLLLGCTTEEMVTLLTFHNQGNQIATVIVRDENG